MKTETQRVEEAASPSCLAGARKSTGSGDTRRRPRILLVTPELGESEVLSRDGRNSPCIKAGGLADVCALILDSMSAEGADVHVAIPHFRRLFTSGSAGVSRQLHLCEDREFFYRRSVYDGCPAANLKAALAFQKDVIQYVLPRVQPDIVHCHDWMTGLVPAAARSLGIPSLFTVHNLHDEQTVLAHIEDRGIDAARFWEHLYYDSYPASYESSRDWDPVSLLASGILAADQMSTVSRSFLHELSLGGHGAPWQVSDATNGKIAAGRAHGVINGLGAAFSPGWDRDLVVNYDAETHVEGKGANKMALQQALGLEPNPAAPVFFWPSRLDPRQKGCGLLAEILYSVVDDYWDTGIQVAFVADGPFQEHFRHIAEFHDLHERIAITDFDERLSHLAYAASDFMLMPSAYEPCGLSQMVALRYGSLPVVHWTGGLRDTVSPLEPGGESGNGFPFEFHDASGLRWAIDQSMAFWQRPVGERNLTVARVIREAADAFQPGAMAAGYRSIYRELLALPK